MDTPRTHRDLISALGGPVRLARSLGIGRPIPTTLHWASRGIPSRYWHRIVEVAAAEGVVLTINQIEQMPTRTDAEIAA